MAGHGAAGVEALLVRAWQIQSSTRRIVTLNESLKEFNAATHPTQEIVPLYNGIIDAAKKELADDPLAGGLEHARNYQGNCSMNAGSMRIVTAQILNVLPPPALEELAQKAKGVLDEKGLLTDKPEV